MENNLKKQKVVLIGPGGIARDYAKVLKSMDVDARAVGRSSEKCAIFEKETGLRCEAIGIEDFLSKNDVQDVYFIITVNTENLGTVLRQLINHKAPHILVEKPAGVDLQDLEKTRNLLEGTGIQPYVAYNRRFYQSFQKAKEIIKEQGKLLSCHFEFTEWAHDIAKYDKTKEALENWLLGNSSHVIDATFSITGPPAKMSNYVSGSLSWHPRAAQFSGAGITTKDVLFSYQANWESAGRWGVEFNTPEGKLILRPLEKLFFQKKGQLNVEEIKLESDVDLVYKPGLYKQVEAFLNHNNENMITLQEHYNNVVNIYEKILGA